MRHVSVFKGIKERLNELLGVHPKDNPEALTGYSIQASMLENCRRIGKGLCFDNSDGVILSGFNGTGSGNVYSFSSGIAVTKSGKIMCIDKSFSGVTVQDGNSVFIKYIVQEVEDADPSPIQNSASKRILYDEHSHAVSEIDVEIFTSTSQPTNGSDWVKIGTRTATGFKYNTPYIKDIEVDNLKINTSLELPEDVVGKTETYYLKNSNDETVELVFENGILQ